MDDKSNCESSRDIGEYPAAFVQPLEDLMGLKRPLAS